MSSETAQEHPLSVYFVVWGALFVLSGFSYMVDYLQLQGNLRWILILTFMWLKAGAIVSVFMHMRWERPALITVILVPPLCLMVLVGLMAVEGGYTTLTRLMFFSTP
jgi:cytochrome c oxidase subunit 4